MTPASIGIVAHMGWVTATTLSVEPRHTVRVIRTDRLETGDPDDREAVEPYHVAGGFRGLTREPRPHDPQAVVRRGLAKQRRRTLANLKRLARAVEQHGCILTHAGIVTGRGRLPDTLDKVIAAHTQIHIAEGIAVRQAVAYALEKLDVTIVELDGKTLPEVAVTRLGIAHEQALSVLKSTRPETTGSWRAEERLAGLAAWVAGT